jgi:hypothetical protein
MTKLLKMQVTTTLFSNSFAFVHSFTVSAELKTVIQQKDEVIESLSKPPTSMEER